MRVLGACPMLGEFTLAVPKAMHLHPIWLTHFENYEDELLAEPCPLPTISSLLNSGFSAISMAKPHPGCIPTSGNSSAFEVYTQPTPIPKLIMVAFRGRWRF